MSEICSELTIKTPKKCHWLRSGNFIVNFEHVSHLFLVLHYWLLTSKYWLGRDAVFRSLHLNITKKPKVNTLHCGPNFHMKSIFSWVLERQYGEIQYGLLLIDYVLWSIFHYFKKGKLTPSKVISYRWKVVWCTQVSLLVDWELNENSKPCAESPEVSSGKWHYLVKSKKQKKEKMK